MMSSDPDSTPSSLFLMELVGRGGSEEMVGVGAMLSFSCCLCPAGELKPCFSVSATEQQQNQYSKHCKRNTPSADVHGIFPNHYFFFPVWFNFDSVLTPSLLTPTPSAACAALFQLVFWLRSVRVPVLLWAWSQPHRLWGGGAEQSCGWMWGSQLA